MCLSVLLGLRLGSGDSLLLLVGLLLLERGLGLGGERHLAQLVFVIRLTYVLILNATQVLEDAD